MSTGFQSVDAQHKELIARINELHAACLAGKAREEIVKQLDFLGSYASKHFTHEENIMEDHQCPARGQNKAAHAKFLQDYQHLAEMVKTDGATTKVAIELKRMLADWLSSHICGVDVRLRTCANKHGRSSTNGMAQMAQPRGGSSRDGGFNDF